MEFVSYDSYRSKQKKDEATEKVRKVAGAGDVVDDTLKQSRRDKKRRAANVLLHLMTNR